MKKLHPLILLMLLATASMAQVPTITSFTPAHGQVGTSVTITGTNFNATPENNIVFFGATRGVVTAASATQLTVTVPTGATQKNITVINTATSKMGASGVPFRITFGPGRDIESRTFNSKVDFGTSGGTGTAFSVADVDGDGKADLAIIKWGVNYNVTIHRNASSGGAEADAWDAGVDVYAYGAKDVVLADLDNDGKPELIVTATMDHKFHIYPNIATPGSITAASFGSRQEYSAPSCSKIAVADIDGDGWQDVLISKTDSKVSVYRNPTTVAGNFSGLAAPVNLTALGQTDSVVPSDIDGDGKTDIVVAEIYPSNRLSIFRNIATAGIITTGSFAARVDFAGPAFPNAMDIDDLDGDGKPDLVVTSNTGHLISVYRNTASPGSITTSSLAAGVNYATANSPTSVDIDDLDGDGKPDLVIGTSSFKVCVFRNVSVSGTIDATSFQARVDYAGPYPNSVVMGDVNSDGKPDIIAGGQASFSVYRNRTDYIAPATPSGITTAAGSREVVLRWTANAESDLANYKIYGGTIPNPASLIATLSAAETSYTHTGLVDGTTYYYRMVAIDNMDNESASSSDITGMPVLPLPPVITSMTPSAGLPGTTVILSGNRFNATASSNIVYFGATRATVTQASTTQLTVTVPEGATYQPVTVVDLATGLSDTSPVPFTVEVFRGTGRDFTSSSFISSAYLDIYGYEAGAVAIGDLDNDGLPDMAVLANETSLTKLRLYKNYSEGGNLDASAFYYTIDLPIGQGKSRQVAIADIDGDGRQDIVLTIEGTNTGFFVFRNVASTVDAGSFVRHYINIGAATSGLAVGDVDDDGRKDVLLSNPQTNSIAICHNTSYPGEVSFTHETLNTGTTVNNVAINDIDGDGKPELITANTGSNSLSVFRNISSTGSLTAASFAARVDINTGDGSYPHQVVMADMDGDGKSDLVVSNRDTKTISIYRNTSSSGSITGASFTKTDFTTGAGAPRALAVADLDGDGKPDVAVLNLIESRNQYYVSVFRNTSAAGNIVSGYVQQGNVFGAANTPEGIIVADLNNDGQTEIGLIVNGATIIYGNQMDFAPPTAPEPIVSSGDAKNALSWQASPEQDVASYKVLGGTTSHPTTLLTTISAPAVYYVHTGLTNGTTYYYRLVAVDALGNESDPSDDVSSAPVSLNVPVVTQFTPTKGNPGTTITITGMHFGTGTTNNIVFFGAAKASVVSASATQLTVTVPVGATYAPVSVLNTTTGLSGSSVAFFAPTFGNERNVDLRNESLGERVDIAAASFADVVAGDIDGDGKQDMIGLNRADGSESIMLFRNTATPGSVDGSTFASPVSISIGADPRSVVLADLDNDGKLDLIVSGYSDGTVSVFRNTATTGGFSSGTFASAVNLTAGDGPSSLAIADIDGDGKRDIVVASSEMVSIFRNISPTGSITAGSFASRVDLDANPENVSLSDIDGDGMVDILISEPGNHRYAIYRNVASPGVITTSSFMPPVYFDGYYSQHLAIADVDRDGKFDVAVSKHLANAYIHRNTASLGNITPGSLGSGLEFANGDNLQDLLFGDIDGDGNQDFVAAISDNSAGISIRRVVAHTGTIDYNSFGDQVWIDVDNSGNEFIGGLTFADVDGDGQQDLLMATSEKISVYRNKVDAQAPAAPQLLSVTPGDGSATLQIATPTDTDIVSYQVRAVLASDPEGEYNSENIDVGQPLYIYQGLYNGSSFIFTVYAKDAYGNYSPVSNSITATPAPPASPVITEVAPLSVAAGTSVTLTGENFNATAASNQVYFGVTKAEVTSASATKLTVTVPVGAAYGPVSVTNKAISRSGWSQQPFAARVGAGMGQDFTERFFQKTTQQQSGDGYSTGMALGDIDGDGKPELVVANYNYSTMSIYRNISSGNTTADVFASAVDFYTESGPAKVVIADLDVDGKNDIVIVNENSGTLSMFRNTATAGTIDGDSFAPAEILFINSYALCVADVDLDGKPDLITSDWNEGNVNVRRNLTRPGVINFETFSVPVSLAPNFCYSLAAGDLDGDGKPEIVGADYDNGRTLVFHNTANRGNISPGAFEAPVALANSNAYTVAIADLDQDGKSDVVTGNFTNKIAIFRNISSPGNIGEGSFATKVELSIGASHWDSWVFAVNDLDGDGRPDVVSVEGNYSKIVAFRNLSVPGSITTDSFKAPVSFSSGDNEYPYAIVLGDVDGDGKSDMVVPNVSTVTLAIFHNAADLAAPVMPAGLAVAAGNTQNVLKWTASTDINLASYRVYGGTTPNPATLLQTVDVPATTYTHSGIANNITYYYRIASVKTYGYESEKTADVKALFCVPLAKPVIMANLANIQAPVLTSSAAEGNQWYLDGTAIAGATQQTHTVTAKGMYTTKVTVGECSSEVSSEVSIIITGIAVAEGSGMLQVYPNPAKDKLFISLPGKAEKRIVITDLQGRVVYRGATAEAETTIPVSDYTAGVYIIVVTTQQGNEVVKFIKQ